MFTRYFFVIITIFLFTILFPKYVFAHDASLTYTAISIHEKTIDVVMTTPYNNILQLSSDPSMPADKLDPSFFTKFFLEGFQFTADDHTCRPKLLRADRNTDIKSFAFHYTVSCPKPIGTLHILYNLFFTISPTHENITDIHAGNYEKQLIFSSTNHIFDLNYAQQKTDQQSFELVSRIMTFLNTGVLHILTGYDHILFLLGLLIVTTKLKSLLKVITSFTIAHSITLSIATLGIFLFPARFTESMIALSIVFVAVEDLFILKSQAHSTRFRWVVAFLFGLIHGFGFSTALREIGLPQSEIAPALISFNVGVEIGQLLIIACLYPIIIVIRKSPWGSRTIQIVAIITGILGLVWFFQRALGL